MNLVNINILANELPAYIWPWYLQPNPRVLNPQQGSRITLYHTMVKRRDLSALLSKRSLDNDWLGGPDSIIKLVLNILAARQWAGVNNGSLGICCEFEGANLNPRPKIVGFGQLDRVSERIKIRAGERLARLRWSRWLLRAWETYGGRSIVLNWL